MITTPLKCGSIESEGGPDPGVDVGVDVVAVVESAGLKFRKGEGATSERWKRARNSLAWGGGCSPKPLAEGSFISGKGGADGPAIDPSATFAAAACCCAKCMRRYKRMWV